MGDAQTSPAVMAMDDDARGAMRFQFARPRRQLAHRHERRLGDLHDGVFVRLAAVEQETGRRGIFALIALAQRGAVRGREWNYLTRDGTRVPVSLSISAVRDAEDQICGIVCSVMT